MLPDHLCKFFFYKYAAKKNVIKCCKNIRFLKYVAIKEKCVKNFAILKKVLKKKVFVMLKLEKCFEKCCYKPEI